MVRVDASGPGLRPIAWVSRSRPYPPAVPRASPLRSWLRRRREDLGFFCLRSFARLVGGASPWLVRFAADRIGDVLHLLARRGRRVGLENLAVVFPEASARELARRIDEDVRLFERRVRRLKELGLTESLEVGYRLSPRGRALLARFNGHAD